MLSKNISEGAFSIRGITQSIPIVSNNINHVSVIGPQIKNSSQNHKSDDKSHLYWAKGTGFGTGSTTQSWNVEQALSRQRSEEQHVTVLLQVS